MGKSSNFNLVSECRPNEMSYITANDVGLVSHDDIPVKRDALFMQILWPSGLYQRGYMQIKNANLKDLINGSVIGRFGPVNVRIKHFNHYGSDKGPSVWQVAFHANSVLAQRYVLMADDEFQNMCGSADWNRLMKGERGSLPVLC